MHTKLLDTWSVVLAAGDGNRLRKLTTDAAGDVIPKQFCSLHQRECLLQLALHRAAGISRPERVCSIVSARHRRWWKTPLQGLSAANIFVQPANKGTAIGATLSLLHVERVDPEAMVVLLPADHYVLDEEVLASSLTDLALRSARDPESILLLGAEPDCADSELGYVVPGTPEPGSSGPGARRVDAFVEKPSPDQARELLSAGAVWNMFIVAGSVARLLGLIEQTYNFVAPLRAALDEPGYLGALSRLYVDLPSVDFSRDVLAHYPERLKIMTVPPCGWTDLGTPKRVTATAQATRRRGAGCGAAPEAMYLDLGKVVGAS